MTTNIEVLARQKKEWKSLDRKMKKNSQEKEGKKITKKTSALIEDCSFKGATW